MSGGSISVWLASEPEVDTVLAAQGWSRVDGQLGKEGRKWWGRVSGPRKVYPDDVPEAVAELLSTVAWLVEIWYEGHGAAAERAVRAAALAVARANRAVVSDDRGAWQPGRQRRVPTGRTRRKAEPDLFVMSWWAAGGPLTTDDGIAALIRYLESGLSMALPDRWDVGEPPSHRLATEGVEALIGFLKVHRSESPGLWPKPPVYRLRLQADFWGGRFELFRPTFFWIGVDAALIQTPDTAEQLRVAFVAITDIIQPYYSEARSNTNWPGHDPGRIMSIEGGLLGHWTGVPVEAPIAMAVGPPYLEHWPAAALGLRRGQLVLHVADWWPTPPPSGCPRPPASIAEAERSPKIAALGTRANRPPVWPFDDSRHGSFMGLSLEN